MSSFMTRVLAVESEATLRDFLTGSLVNAGFELETVASAGEALQLINKNLPEVMLVDRILPDISGLHLARLLRENQRTAKLPIIMLGSGDDATDNAKSGDGDVDDFIVKPFNSRELVTRIRALLRRSAPQHGGEVMAFAGVVLDSAEVSVSVDGLDYRLRPVEFKLLRLLLSQPRRVFTRSQVIDLVWGDQHVVDARTVDVTMRRLRKALGPRGRDLLETVRGIGYRFSGKEAGRTHG